MHPSVEASMEELRASTEPSVEELQASAEGRYADARAARQERFRRQRMSAVTLIQSMRGSGEIGDHFGSDNDSDSDDESNNSSEDELADIIAADDEIIERTIQNCLSSEIEGFTEALNNLAEITEPLNELAAAVAENEEEYEENEEVSQTDNILNYHSDADETDSISNEDNRFRYVTGRSSERVRRQLDFNGSDNRFRYVTGRSSERVRRQLNFDNENVFQSPRSPFFESLHNIFYARN